MWVLPEEAMQEELLPLMVQGGFCKSCSAEPVPLPKDSTPSVDPQMHKLPHIMILLADAFYLTN